MAFAPTSGIVEQHFRHARVAGFHGFAIVRRIAI